MLLITIDSAILKQPDKYVIQISSQTESFKTASNHKTVSPLFPRTTFQFDLLTKQVKVTCLRDAGNSLAHYGESKPVIIEHLGLQNQESVARSIALLDFKQQNVGRLNITVEATDDRDYIRRKLATLVDQINDKSRVPTRPRVEMLTTTEGSNELGAEWILVVDVRSATNLPLNAETDHGLPSTRVQLDWSSTV